MKRKTAKNKWRPPKKASNKVEHHYTDFAHVSECDLIKPATSNRKKESELYFPVRLYDTLSATEAEGLEDVISWQPHGRCFLIRNQERFIKEVLPRWFSTSKFTSFQRQLSLYDFKRLTTGRDRGAYYHEAFLRGKRFLAQRIPRTRIKGTWSRRASSPETEPNFYHIGLPFLPPSNTKSKKNKTPQEKNQTNVSLLSGAAHSGAPDIDKNEASQQEQGNLSLLSKAAQSRLPESRVPKTKENKAAQKLKPSLASHAVRYRAPETKTAKASRHASPSSHVPAPAATVSPIGDDRRIISQGLLDSAIAAESSRQRSLLAQITGPSNGPVSPAGAVLPPQQTPPRVPMSHGIPMLPAQQPIVVLVLPGEALPPGSLNDPLRAAAAVASLLRGG